MSLSGSGCLPCSSVAFSSQSKVWPARVASWQCMLCPPCFNKLYSDASTTPWWIHKAKSYFPQCILSLGIICPPCARRVTLCPPARFIAPGMAVRPSGSSKERACMQEGDHQLSRKLADCFCISWGQKRSEKRRRRRCHLQLWAEEEKKADLHLERTTGKTCLNAKGAHGAGHSSQRVRINVGAPLSPKKEGHPYPFVWGLKR
jgi:hypothetical protein